jgi:hypothetical protein
LEARQAGNQAAADRSYRETMAMMQGMTAATGAMTSMSQMRLAQQKQQAQERMFPLEERRMEAEVGGIEARTAMSQQQLAEMQSAQQLKQQIAEAVGRPPEVIDALFKAGKIQQLMDEMAEANRLRTPAARARAEHEEVGAREVGAAVERETAEEARRLGAPAAVARRGFEEARAGEKVAQVEREMADVRKGAEITHLKSKMSQDRYNIRLTSELMARGVPEEQARTQAERYQVDLDKALTDLNLAKQELKQRQIAIDDETLMKAIAESKGMDWNEMKFHQFLVEAKLAPDAETLAHMMWQVTKAIADIERGAISDIAAMAFAFSGEIPQGENPEKQKQAALAMLREHQTHVKGWLLQAGVNWDTLGITYTPGSVPKVRETDALIPGQSQPTQATPTPRPQPGAGPSPETPTGQQDEELQDRVDRIIERAKGLGGNK